MVEPTPAALVAQLAKLARDRRRDLRSGRREYERAVQEVLEAGEQVLADGGPGTLAGLGRALRTAVDRIVAALQVMDGPGGAVGHLLEDVVALHGRVAAVAPPPAGTLVRWLVRCALRDGARDTDVALHAQALGTHGLRLLGERAKASADDDGTDAQGRRALRDVIGPYRAVIAGRLVEAGDRHHYRRALEPLTPLRRAHLACDDEAGFDAYVHELRGTWRRPTLVRQLERELERLLAHDAAQAG